MGKKGGRRHLKRKPAPAFWPIHRKEKVWTTKPNPGPHSIDLSIPLALVLRDILGFAKTRGEAKAIVSRDKVMVDGKVQKEILFPIGLMDIMAIPEVDQWYRMLPSAKGLTMHQVGKNEADFKLCRIEGKTVTKDGVVQINLHDGRNIAIKIKDSNKPEEDIFKTFDTVKIVLPTQEIAGHFRLAEGAPALIVNGKNIGRHGRIVALDQKKAEKQKNALVTVEDEKGIRFQTIVDYVFVIGDAKPSISLPEVT